jgi:succinate dehydrogenase / fumarate reductase cytochrome b subunit
MQSASTFFDSTIGKKVVMALSGIVLVGFVFAHMTGNLQIYLGPETMNAYGRLLHELGHGAALWVARAVLLLCVALHIWAAVSLTRQSRAARPVGYRQQSWTESTYASRTMSWSGPILLLFILYHLAHLTTGQAHPQFVEGDAYGNLIVGFQSVPVVVFYVAAMLALGLHLYHGIWSMLQTLGLSHPRYNPWRHALATLITVAVVGANITFPLAVFFGFVS